MYVAGERYEGDMAGPSPLPRSLRLHQGGRSENLFRTPFNIHPIYTIRNLTWNPSRKYHLTPPHEF